MFHVIHQYCSEELLSVNHRNTSSVISFCKTDIIKNQHDFDWWQKKGSAE